MPTAIFIAIVVAAGGLISILWKYAKSKWTTLDTVLQKTQLDDVAIAATTKVYQEYVRDLKKAAEDGKLTAAEKDAAMSKAVESFKTIAKEEGIPVVLRDPMIKSLIEKAVKKLKS